MIYSLMIWDLLTIFTIPRFRISSILQFLDEEIPPFLQYLDLEILSSFFYVCRKQVHDVQKKGAAFFFFISLAIKIPEGWGITHLKYDIHGYSSSAKCFLYNIREARYKGRTMWFINFNSLDIENFLFVNLSFNFQIINLK